MIDIENESYREVKIVAWKREEWWSNLSFNQSTE